MPRDRHGPWRRSYSVCSPISQKLATKQPLSRLIKEHWSDRTELGGSTSSYVANQVDLAGQQRRRGHQHAAYHKPPDGLISTNTPNE
jgi:hypothetical protein